MKKYGEIELISSKYELIIEKIDKKLESLNDCYLYYGYPCSREGDKTLVLKMMLICPKGIFNFIESNDSKNMFRKHVQKNILSIDSLADKLDEGVSIVHHININDIDETRFVDYDDVITSEEIKKFNSIFQNAGSFIVKDERSVSNPNTLGYKIKKRNNDISLYDETQFSTIYSTVIDTNIRIRGLAGSGKTILLAKKMAYLHYRYPELCMAYVFYTISLKQYIERLFIKFYKDFNDESNINFEKIKFLHSWGSRTVTGFYSDICDKYNVERMTYSDVSAHSNSFSVVCQDLMSKLPNGKLGIYDYIFVDEAQDFPLDFYFLCRKALSENGKLIYAYDELQTLYSTSSIPTKIEIFGNEVCEDINLETCYRTPKEILVTAHAIGMGIYKKNGTMKDLCNIPEDLSIWNAIGYKSVFNIAYGKPVELYRDPTLIKYKCEDPICFGKFEDKEKEFEETIKNIYKLIRNEDVLCEDIMIIDLDGSGLEENFFLFKQKCINYLNIVMSGNKRPYNVHLINKTNAYNFKVNNSIPYTTIFRAKGNEANIVFILNADKLTSLSSYSRNKLFTAMTRAKFKVYIYGTDKIQQYIDEYEKVVSEEYTLKFLYPTVDELKEIRTLAINEEKKCKRDKQSNRFR